MKRSETRSGHQDDRFDITREREREVSLTRRPKYITLRRSSNRLNNGESNTKSECKVVIDSHRIVTFESESAETMMAIISCWFKYRRTRRDRSVPSRPRLSKEYQNGETEKEVQHKSTSRFRDLLQERCCAIKRTERSRKKKKLSWQLTGSYRHCSEKEIEQQNSP